MCLCLASASSGLGQIGAKCSHDRLRHISATMRRPVTARMQGSSAEPQPAPFEDGVQTATLIHGSTYLSPAQQHLWPPHELAKRPGILASKMPSISVSTDWIPESPTASASTSAAWRYVEIRVSYVNFGPLTTAFTPPPACATEPVYSLHRGNATTAFRCPDPLAYKSCLPSSESASRFSSDWGPGSHDHTFTYHSPGWVCPSGWTVATEFAVPSYDSYGGHSGSISPAGISSIVSCIDLPSIGGEHRLCCPSSFSLTLSSSVYGCQSIGLASNRSFVPYCSTSCAFNTISDCATITAAPSPPAALSPPTASTTYGIEAVYLISPTPSPDQGPAANERHIAVIATAVAIVVLLGIGIAWLLIRRHRREQARAKIRENMELPGYPPRDPSSGDEELPDYSRRDPMREGVELPNYSRRDPAPSATAAYIDREPGAPPVVRPATIGGGIRREEDRPERNDRYEAPPAYDSPVGPNSDHSTTAAGWQ